MMDGEKLHARICEMIGAGSTCWDREGVFNTERALGLVHALRDDIEAYVNNRIAIALAEERIFRGVSK